MDSAQARLNSKFFMCMKEKISTERNEGRKTEGMKLRKN